MKQAAGFRHNNRAAWAGGPVSFCGQSRIGYSLARASLYLGLSDGASGHLRRLPMAGFYFSGRKLVNKVLTLRGYGKRFSQLTQQEGRFYNGAVLTTEKAEARRGARLSRAERVTVTVTDPCEPDLGNSSGGKRRLSLFTAYWPPYPRSWRPFLLPGTHASAKVASE